MVEEAVRLRARFRRRIDRQLEKALPTETVLRKWHLQELKYCLGRSLYLEPFEAYDRLEAASAGVPELRETWSVVHAVATGDVTEVVRVSGHAPQALAGLLRAGGAIPLLTHGPLTRGEPEVQALALLRLYGVKVTPAAIDSGYEFRPIDVEDSPLHRVGRGLAPLPDTASPFGYYDELACLGEGRTDEERLRTFATRFSADEEIAFDALSLDLLSDDEPGLGMVDPY